MRPQTLFLNRNINKHLHHAKVALQAPLTIKTSSYTTLRTSSAMTEFFTLFFLLIAGHALADFVLQSDVMAAAKSRHGAIHKRKSKHFPPWQYWLGAHTLIHGGIVLLITESLLLGLIETCLHTVIDFLKCEGKLSFHQDQALHLLCKVIYCAVLVYAPGRVLA